jgi:hypothetical protein
MPADIAEVFIMRAFVRCCFYFSLLSAIPPALAAMETAGVDLADHYTVGDQSLVLNGAGIRTKFFFKIYVGALYLASATHDAGHTLTEPGAKSMQMAMLYRKVGADKIAEGWTDGFRANLSSAQFKRVATQLRQFNALFPDLKAGDRVYMDYIPGEGTTVTINKDRRGRVAGDDFFAALLKVWIGAHPADDDLKRGLLGK